MILVSIIQVDIYIYIYIFIKNVETIYRCAIFFDWMSRAMVFERT